MIYLLLLLVTLPVSFVYTRNDGDVSVQVLAELLPTYPSTCSVATGRSPDPRVRRDAAPIITTAVRLARADES